MQAVDYNIYISSDHVRKITTAWLMLGLGGLISIIGGLLFLIVC
jgi:hypothetical protein